MSRALSIETLAARVVARCLVQLKQSSELIRKNGIGYTERYLIDDTETMSCVRFYGHSALTRAYACVTPPLLGKWECELVSSHGRLKREAKVSDIQNNRVDQLRGSMRAEMSGMMTIPFNARCVVRSETIGLYQSPTIAEMHYLVLCTEAYTHYRVLSGMWKYPRALYDAAILCEDMPMYIVSRDTFSDANIVFALVMDIKESFKADME